MIYFVQPAEGGPVKIGTTERLESRLDELDAHYGRPMMLLATMEGGREREQELHQRFEHLRLGRTEQFRPGADLMEFIGRPLLVGIDPDIVEVIPSRKKVASIQIDDDLVKRARLVALLTDKPMATLVAEILGPILIRMEAEELAKRNRTKGGKP